MHANATSKQCYAPLQETVNKGIGCMSLSMTLIIDRANCQLKQSNIKNSIVFVDSTFNSSSTKAKRRKKATNSDIKWCWYQQLSEKITSEDHECVSITRKMNYTHDHNTLCPPRVECLISNRSTNSKGVVVSFLILLILGLNNPLCLNPYNLSTWLSAKLNALSMLLKHLSTA